MAHGEKVTGKAPRRKIPAHHEMERAVLGAIMLAGSRPPGLDLRDFDHPDHRAIYRWMVDLEVSGGGLDITSVLSTAQGMTAAELAELGGLPYLAALPSHCTSMEAVPNWLKSMRQARKDRETRERIQRAAEAAEAGDLVEAEALLKVRPLGNLPEAVTEILPDSGKAEHGVMVRLKPIRNRPDRVKADEVLRWDSRWEGRIWWDDYRKQKMLGERPYQDADDTRISLWLSRVYRLDVAPAALGQVIDALARDHSRDPLREYLLGIRWDGTERIANWLQWGMGVEDTPIRRWIGQAWLVQAVARALTPGCQADATLVLMGDQGEGKTSTLRELVGAFWSESKIDIGNTPRCYQQVAAAWVHELGEMADFLGSRLDQNEAKNFLTSPTDRFIPLHARSQVEWARRAVFVGTTNRPEILRDPTGARRFWPVEAGVTGPIQRAKVVGLRDQLWAEAVAQFQAGFEWWLPKSRWAELREVQADYRASDSWEDRILEWLNDPAVKMAAELVTSRRILVGAIGKKLDQITRADEMRVGEIMAGLQWRHKAVWNGTLKRTVNAFIPKDPTQYPGWEPKKKEDER